jgi:para-nitrobenzyl esterase
MICQFSARHSSIAIFMFAAAILLQFDAGPVFAASDAMTVRTTGGQLRGVARPSGGAEFLGIPYAQPPVGDLRWHEPMPTKPWGGVRDANTFGAPCEQPVLGDWNRKDAEASKEDCLYLNVMTPEWPAKKPLPVMFWIHGGGNEGGTASSELYKDGTLVSHGVVLVTVNYRLGIFGFLAHPELTRESAHGGSGNYGLMDQILALRWVRDNIARFGGDPANITVFGQSAGAMDTGMLMTSSAKDHFQKAIAESGASFSPPLPALADAEKAGEGLAASLKAPAGDGAIKYLRQLSAQDLLAAVAKLDPKQRPRIGPDIDGWVIRRSPADVFASGQESAIPFIFGTTTREFGSAASADELRKTIEAIAGKRATDALAVYGLADGGQGAGDAKYGTAADQWAADIAFRCPATTQGAWHSAAHHPTYEYEFDHAIPGQEAQGAVHSSDLPYVFGYFPKSGNIAGNFGDTDVKLAELMETYWTNFAKTGNPNSDKVPEWPQLGEARTFIQFIQDGSVVAATGLRKAHCDVYGEVLAERMKQQR